jgi:hypothetical protein
MKKLDLREVLGRHYDLVDPRRRQEVADSRMIQEDENAMANLPERPVYHEYNEDRFKYDSNSAGSPDLQMSEVGPWPKRRR